MKLTEIINASEIEKSSGYINLDDWRWPDVDYLVSMGFSFQDDHKMISDLSTDKDGKNKITIYKKKDKDSDNKTYIFFFIDEPERGIKRFRSFNDVIDYFDHYSQPIFDKNI